MALHSATTDKTNEQMNHKEGGEMSMRPRISVMTGMVLAACFSLIVVAACPSWALTNLAPSGTASASATWPDANGAYDPIKAIDGSHSTRWSGMGSGTEWWQVSWTTPQTFSRVVIDSGSKEWPMSIKAWNSATSQFDVIATLVLPASITTTVNFGNVTTTTLRLQDVISIDEVEVYYVPEPASILGLVFGVLGLGLTRRRR